MLILVFFLQISSCLLFVNYFFSQFPFLLSTFKFVFQDMASDDLAQQCASIIYDVKSYVSNYGTWENWGCFDTTDGYGNEFCYGASDMDWDDTWDESYNYNYDNYYGYDDWMYNYNYDNYYGYYDLICVSESDLAAWADSSHASIQEAKCEVVAYYGAEYVEGYKDFLQGSKKGC